MSISQSIVEFKCPRCNGKGTRKYHSRKKVCDRCHMANKVEAHRIGMLKREIKKEHQIAVLKEIKNKVIEPLKTIFVSDQECFYMMPEGDVL